MYPDVLRGVQRGDDRPHDGQAKMIRKDWPCVDFTKTTGWEARDRSDDDLSSYDGLVDWAAGAGVLDASTAERLRSRAKERPREAEEVLATARRIRTALYGVLTAVAREDDPPAGALDELNAVLEEATSRLRLSGEGRTYRWVFEDSAREDMRWPLWLVARSAGELLTSDEVARLELCDAHDCGWLFIDASRNRSRRWCDMADCGNRAKVRRYRERHGD